MLFIQKVLRKITLGLEVKKKDSQLDGIKDPDGGKDLEDLSKPTNNFSLLLGLSLSKQWIMIFTARYLVQPDDR
jgi:hypothetical protein